MAENNNENIDEYDFNESIILSLDDGSELPCIIVSIFEVEGQDYIALLPQEGPEYEEGEVFLYRYAEKDGEPELGNIENDEEFEKVSEKFDEILDSMEYDEIVDGEEIE
ncbi:MAG: DUF1292 domain-containing protein [Lachnospiraceae bacterium]|nr:DUF1292 domain-containing protein [Lachnospiraceae bacterium]